VLEEKSSQAPQGIIIFWDGDVDVDWLPNYLVSSRLRFGESEQKGPIGRGYQTLYVQGPYLQDDRLRDYPFKLICLQNPTMGICVHFQDKNNNWACERFGKIEESELFAEVERSIAQEFDLPLVGVLQEEQEAEEKEAEEKGGDPLHPAIESANSTSKIKDLIREGQEALALQLVRSLDDPEIYEALLSDCCELRDEDEGWIQVSELFKEHDALFYQLLALAPEEANLPGPLRLESIEDIHLNNCSDISNLDFLRDYRRLKSFSIWGFGEDAADLNDISGLSGLTRLKSLRLNGLKSSPDWTPLQHLVQLRELTLSGEKLAHTGPQVFSRLTNLNSLTLNEGKSLTSLSFLESLKSLRYLRIDGYGGDSLKGIGECRKITELSISDAGKLEDISELSSLSRLRELSLSGKFQNLDPLKSLASLQTLYINDAKELRDVSGLSGCLGLERINLTGVSSLGSLWGIGQLKSLQELEVYSWESTSGCIDIHEVGELSNLRDLTISCSGRALRGFPTVRHLEKLRSLDLSGCNCCGVTDLSPLRKLKLLNSLKMANCQSVTNLNGLSNLHCLEILELIGLPRVASLSGLQEFDQLQQLTITGCTEIKGLDDLANLNSLTHLALRNFDKLCDASGIRGMTQLETLDLEGSERLSDISFLDDLESLNNLDLSYCHRIHPDDFVYLYEDDFETLYLPDEDEYEDEDNDDSEAEEGDEEEENPWGERNLNDIPDDEWLRLYNKEQGAGLLQRAVREGWLDQVPEHVLTNKNLLAVEAIHIAASNRDFSQIPDSLLTVENLLAEDADHHWNVFHFAAGYGSLDLLPDHLLVEKNLQVPTRVDCPLFDNIFSGSTCLHIAAAKGILTLLPRSVLTPKNLLLKDARGNTPLDKAKEGLQALKDTIAELEGIEAGQDGIDFHGEIDFHGDWLQTSQIQVDHLRQQVAEAEIPEEPEAGTEVTEPDEEQDESRFDSDGENGSTSEPELAVTGDDDLATDSETPAEQDELELGPAQVGDELSSHPSEQSEPVEKGQRNGHPLDLPDDEMFRDGQRVLTTHAASIFELSQQSSDSSHAAIHIAEQSETVGQGQENEPSVGLIDAGIIDKDMRNDEQAEPLQRMHVTEVSLDAHEDHFPIPFNQSASQEEAQVHKINITELSLDDQSAPQEEAPVHKINITELSLDDQSAPQEEEPVTEEPVIGELETEESEAEEPETEEPETEEPEAEEPEAEEPVIEEEISPLVMNTWFHSLDEAIDHPKAVVTLDIIHQESVDRLDVLSEFPYLEELHFIKVNIDNFKGLIPAPKLCHIKFESCEVNGWMGLLDLPGLKKVGCYPGVPPEKVKQLLEEGGVEIYLFTPTRINNSEASGAPELNPETQVICEEAIA